MVQIQSQIGGRSATTRLPRINVVYFDFLEAHASTAHWHAFLHIIWLINDMLLSIDLGSREAWWRWTCIHDTLDAKGKQDIPDTMEPPLLEYADVSDLSLAKERIWVGMPEILICVLSLRSAERFLVDFGKA